MARSPGRTGSRPRRAFRRALVWGVALLLAVPLLGGAREADAQSGRRERRTSVDDSRRAPSPGRIVGREGARRSEQPVRFLYKNTPLERIIEDYSKLSGERFLIDERARKRVTIAMKRQVSLDEARALLDAALLYMGMALLRGPADVWKLVDAGTPPPGAPFTTEPEERNFAPAVTLARVEHAPRQAVLAVLQEFVGQGTIVSAVDDGSSILLASSEAQLHRLLSLIDALDQGATTNFLVRRLRNANAVEAEPIVREALGLDNPLRPDTGFRLLADARLNALVAIGRQRELAQARQMIDDVDRSLQGSGRIEVVRVEYRDAEEVGQRVQSMISAAAEFEDASQLVVAVDPPTGSILLTGKPSAIKEARALIAEIDRPTPQVMLEFTLMTISDSENVTLGTASLGGALFGGNAVVITQRPPGGFLTEPGADQSLINYTDPLPNAFVEPVTGEPLSSRFQVVARASEGHTETIQRPRLLAASGEEQRISIGANIPIPVAASGGGTDASNPLVQRTNIERQDIGIEITVVPTIGAEGGIGLETSISVTDLVADARFGSVEQVGPTLSNQSLDSRVWLPNGGVTILGALPQTAWSRAQSGTPFLMDIPILGHLFKVTSTWQPSHQTVVFAVQAWIERTPEERIADTIRMRLGAERALDRAPLGLGDGGPSFGVRVATFEREDEARAVRDSLPPAFARASIEAWDFFGERLFDLVVHEYDSIADAAEAALELAELGWRAELVALPHKRDRARRSADRDGGDRS